MQIPPSHPPRTFASSPIPPSCYPASSNPAPISFPYASRPSHPPATYGLTPAALRTLRALSTPALIQRFLDDLPYQYANTAWSPARALRERRGHCLEGALLAAAVLAAALAWAVHRRATRFDALGHLAGARPRGLVCVSSRERAALAGSALFVGLSLQLVDAPLAGALAIVVAMVCSVVRAPRAQAETRGPGRWLLLRPEEAFVSPRSGTARGKLVTALGLSLALAGLVAAGRLLASLQPEARLFLPLDAVVLLPLLGSGLASQLPPDRVSRGARWLARCFRRIQATRSLRASPWARVPTGLARPDEVRVLVVPREPMPGLSGIEIGAGVGSRRDLVRRRARGAGARARGDGRGCEDDDPRPLPESRSLAASPRSVSTGCSPASRPAPRPSRSSRASGTGSSTAVSSSARAPARTAGFPRKNARAPRLWPSRPEQLARPRRGGFERADPSAGEILRRRGYKVGLFAPSTEETMPDRSALPASQLHALCVYAEPLVAGRRVVVLGDGTRRLGERLLELGARVVHVYDPQPARAASLADEAPRGLTVLPLPAGDFDVRDGAFDLAVVADISELPAPAALLARLRRILAPGGAVLVRSRCVDAAERGRSRAGAGQGTLDYYELFESRRDAVRPRAHDRPAPLDGRGAGGARA